MKICPKCNNNHEKPGTFCSRSCANSRGPRSADFKKKVGDKLRGKSPHNKGKHYVERTKINCKTCKKEVEVLGVKTKRKYCCKECFYSDPEKTLGGYREGSGRAKTGYYKGIYCGSTYELVWCIYQLDHNIQFERFSKKLEYNKTIYFPDFIIGNTIIEIKGYENSESVKRKCEVAIKNGYNIVVLYKEDLKDCFDWVTERYNTKIFYDLYDNYKPKFTYICHYCKNEYETDIKKEEINFCSRTCSGKYSAISRVFSEETKRKISDSLKGKKRADPIKKYKRKYKQFWINNGKTETRIAVNTEIPEGFNRGRIYKVPD